MNVLRFSWLTIGAGLLGACAAPPTKNALPPAPTTAVVTAAVSTRLPKLPDGYTQKGVAVKIDSLWQSPEGTILGVNGTAKNVTASDLRFCQVSLLFVDDSGMPVAGAKVSTKSLKSAQIWHFQAALDRPSTTSYASIVPDKTVAIPVKSPKAELAALK